MMVEEADIYRSANVLVWQHGDDAPTHAAMRADQMLDAGDMGGFAVWRRIVKAVEGLLRVERPAGTKLQCTVSAAAPCVPRR